MHKIPAVFTLLIVLSSCLRAGSGPVPPPEMNVILIGWDGAQRAHMLEMLGTGKLPNFKALAAEGGMVETQVTETKTETKPGWTEILTGYRADSIGIPSNGDYGPIPPGYTIFERLKERFGDKITTIFLSGKKHNTGFRGPHEICINCARRDPLTFKQTLYQQRKRFKGTTRNGKPPLWVARTGEPYYNSLKAMDHHYGGLGAAGKVGKKALKLLEKNAKKPFFAFIHFEEPDEQAHRFGENSEEYEKGLILADRWLGVLVEKLKAAGLYSSTLVIVTSDHGMDEGGREHMNAPYTLLAINRSRKIRAGDRKDVTPTILDWYGFDLKTITPPLDGSSLFAE